MHRPRFFVQENILTDQSKTYDVMVSAAGAESAELVYAAENEDQADKLAYELSVAVHRII
jgi:hypothetical protein